MVSKKDDGIKATPLQRAFFEKNDVNGAGPLPEFFDSRHVTPAEMKYRIDEGEISRKQLRDNGINPERTYIVKDDHSFGDKLKQSAENYISGHVNGVKHQIDAIHKVGEHAKHGLQQMSKKDDRGLWDKLTDQNGDGQRFGGVFDHKSGEKKEHASTRDDHHKPAKHEAKHEEHKGPIDLLKEGVGKLKEKFSHKDEHHGKEKAHAKEEDHKGPIDRLREGFGKLKEKLHHDDKPAHSTGASHKMSASQQAGAIMQRADGIGAFNMDDNKVSPKEFKAILAQHPEYAQTLKDAGINTGKTYNLPGGNDQGPKHR